MNAVHRIVARFSDGAERVFSCDNGMCLLTAALSAGIALLHQCRAGSCGTCICQRLDGCLEMQRSTSLALLPAEERDGKFLACMTTATSNAAIALAYPSAWLDRAGPRRYDGWIREITRLGDSATQLQLEIDDEDLSFVAGMYFLICVPGTAHWRAYSAASLPRTLPELTFLIRHLPGGAMTKYLVGEAAAGDRLEIEGPYGEFFLRDADAPLIFIAGGTGLAPLLAMLDDIRDRRRHRRPILLCFGVTRYADLFHLEELELRRHWMPQLEVRTAIVIADPRWDGPVAMVTDLLTGADGSAAHRAYVCGPPAMVAAAHARLIDLGLAPEHIHHESFAPSGIGEPSKGIQNG